MKDEKVLCVKKSDLESIFDIYLERIKFNDSDIRLFNKISDYRFIERNIAESDRRYKQLISYCIVINEKNEVLTYRRKGSEERLHGLLSAGIGGHVNEWDKKDTLYKTLYAGAIREIEEELPGISEYSITPYGIINEEYSEVGLVHSGFVFLVNVNSSGISGYDEEISDHSWMRIGEIDTKQFELWSKLALNLICESKRKMFLVFSHKLTEEQIIDARNKHGITEFVYLPENLQVIWSGLRPSGALDRERLNLINEWLEESARDDDMVLLQGDFGAVFYILGMMEGNGFVPVYATTVRESEERVGSDGRVEKIHFFKHVGFRRYVWNVECRM